MRAAIVTPFGDSSALPMFLLSELTREHVTVALCGDGGDELFAGYERFAAALALSRFDRVSEPTLESGDEPEVALIVDESTLLPVLMPFAPAAAVTRRPDQTLPRDHQRRFVPCAQARFPGHAWFVRAGSIQGRYPKHLVDWLDGIEW